MIKSKFRFFSFIIRGFAFTMVLFILFWFSYFFLHPQLIKTTLSYLHFLPEPERFTELYFADHLNLPTTITKHKEYSFVFTVHNLEYKDMEYPYEVYLQRDNQKITLDQGKFTLKNDEFKSIKEDFGPLKNLRAEIVVNLINKNQQIDFWMEEVL